METLDVCRTVDFGAATGDRFLAVDLGETGGDDGSSAETFFIEVCDGAAGAGCSCPSGWQQVLAHTGDFDGQATLSTRHLVADLTGPSWTDPMMGIRFVATASGPGDMVELDRIRVESRSYACPSVDLSLGAIAEIGGGNYSVGLTSSSATTAQLECSWGTIFPPVEGRDDVVYLP
jgi:hypothetical protein